MTKRIILLVLLVIIIFSTLTACSNKYNAEVIVSGFKFKEEFLKENMTYGAVYYNENYNIEDESSREFLVDETSPKSRTFIIKEQNELDAIFTEFPQTDFEKEMVLIYAYTSSNPRDKKIKSIELNDKTLNIEFKSESVKPGYKDATDPQRRIIIVKMDKLDITVAEFVEFI